jgi:NTE family protein
MDGLHDLLLKIMPENSFERLKIPLTIAATEIRQGQIHYFTAGELIPAILASCSIPVLFHPLPFQGGLFVDGGVLDNLPASPIKEHCDFLVGSHCNHFMGDFDPKNMKVVMERSLLMAISVNTKRSKDLCDLVIEPPGLARYSGFEIAKAKEIFDFAYQFTKGHLKKQDFAKGRE